MIKTANNRQGSSSESICAHDPVAPNTAKVEDNSVTLQKLNVEFGTACRNAGKQFRNSNSIINAIFGTEIAPGILVTHASGRAKFHILKTALTNTLSNPNNLSSNFLSAINISQEIVGNTPSLKALRVMFVMLLRDNSISSEDKVKLKETRRELEAIDLNKPRDPNWEKECQIELGGQNLNIHFGLQFVSPITRVLSKLFSHDIDKENRLSKYSINVKISLDEKSKSAFQSAIEDRLHQMKTVGLLLSPVIATLFLRATLLPSNLIPKIFGNGIAQSFLELSSELAPLAVAGALSYLTFEKLRRSTLSH